MDLLFHIGCEKTGTTSVQSWMNYNDTALRSQGIFYSRALGRANNRRIYFYGLEAGTPDDQLRREGITTAEQHAALQQQIAAEFVEEARAARASGIRLFVISNEHCHSRLKSDAAVQRTHDLLAPFFDSMQIHCFLRPQMDMCLSLASTLSRNGMVIDRGWIDREMRPSNQYYLFDDLLERWARVFGRSAIMPVSFKRTPDAVAYFETLLDITALGLPRRPAANTALDYRVIAIINGMSRADPTNRDFEYVLRLFLNELPVEQRLTLDRLSAQSFQHRYLRTNALCCRTWPQIEALDLRPDWGSYPQEGNIDRMAIAEEAGPFIRRILDRMRMENAMEKARRLALTTEREWQLGRPELAMRACRQALSFAREAVKVDAYRKQMEQLIQRLENRLHRMEHAPGTVVAHADQDGD